MTHENGSILVGSFTKEVSGSVGQVFGISVRTEEKERGIKMRAEKTTTGDGRRGVGSGSR